MTRGRYRSPQSNNSSEERDRGKNGEWNHFYAHDARGSSIHEQGLPCALSLWSDSRRDVLSFFSAESGAGMRQPLGRCLCFFRRHRYRSYTAPFHKMNHPKHPQKHLYPIQRNMAGCQVRKSSVNNECCFSHTHTHKVYWARAQKAQRKGSIWKSWSMKRGESRPRECRDENVCHGSV